MIGKLLESHLGEFFYAYWLADPRLHLGWTAAFLVSGTILDAFRIHFSSVSQK
jgi:hypothetical protein